MSEFQAKVDRIRINQQSKDGPCRVLVVVIGESNSQVAKVELQFNEPFEGPSPDLTTVVCLVRDKNQEKKKLRLDYKGLTFSGNPVEFVYEITATMFNTEGLVIGNTSDFAVVVEEFLEEDVV